MKSIQHSIICCAVLVAATMTTPVFAQEITEPLGGKPPAGSKSSVDDFEYQVAYQRAFEAVIWSMPAVSIYGFHRASAELGYEANTIAAWGGPANARLEVLTPNTVTPYTAAVTDLRRGPVVFEAPAATDKAMLWGQVVNHWQITIAGIGPLGIDKGKGAKILLTPPGYDKPIPEGYLEIKSPSYRVALAFRAIPTPKGTNADAIALNKKMKLYYLDDPKPTRFVDPLKVRYPTLPRYDERWFEDLYAIVTTEEVMPRDKVMMGLLKTIGIQKGKPFKPDVKTKKAMRQAAIDAYYYMQTMYVKGLPEELWWKDRRWRDLFVPTDPAGGFKWDLEDMVDYDRRAVHPWFNAIFFPPVVKKRPTTMYLVTSRDVNGAVFEAGKTYSLTVPKEVPVSKFWSLTIYDFETWSLIYNPLNRSGLSSRQLDSMKKNSDGSVTLYVGPKAPKGLETNWIPTAGKTPFFMFRAYGPTEAFYNKTFKMGDVEFVKDFEKVK